MTLTHSDHRQIRAGIISAAVILVLYVIILLMNHTQIMMHIMSAA